MAPVTVVTTAETQWVVRKLGCNFWSDAKVSVWRVLTQRRKEGETQRGMRGIRKIFALKSFLSRGMEIP